MNHLVRVGVVTSAVLLSCIAAADAPSGMVEVSPTMAAPEPGKAPRRTFVLGATDAAVIAAPFEREHRLGLTAGARVLCLNVSTPGYCMGGAQVGFSFAYGDVHFGILETPNSGGDFGIAYLAPYGGIEIGTRYYHVAFRRGRVPMSLGFAARGAAEFMGLLPHNVGDNAFSRYFAFANTYGPNARLLIGSHFDLYARFAVGVGVRALTGPFNNEPTVAGFALDAGLGAEARF